MAAAKPGHQPRGFSRRCDSDADRAAEGGKHRAQRAFDCPHASEQSQTPGYVYEYGLFFRNGDQWTELHQRRSYIDDGLLFANLISLADACLRHKREDTTFAHTRAYARVQRAFVAVDHPLAVQYDETVV
ncbi:hypothetical protein BSFA1_80100 (plasmid) [Burkholderia sp. SFA1]|nr:hypothetical protein BSFA1_80100 [Burkholderia sp. SFA1]